MVALAAYLTKPAFDDHTQIRSLCYDRFKRKGSVNVVVGNSYGEGNCECDASTGRPLYISDPLSLVNLKMS
jgi:hypothetical protein